MSDPGFTPFDDDANTITPQKDETPDPRAGTFAYIGSARTLDQFVTYVNGYSFGTIPPDYVVLHHTAVPSTLYARYPSGAVWDAGEAGMSEAQIKSKRKAQLDSIMRFYRDTRGWSAGPHLFIDERWIWLFSPMAVVGVHAAAGNSYRDNTRALHYSIGIEVVGYYEHTTWPEAVARNVAGAVDALQERLRTFTYIDKPWMGGISAHRHYNKPYCPGAKIVPEYYMPILKAASAPAYPRYRVTSPCAVFTGPAPDAPLAGGPDNGQTWLEVGNVIQVGDSSNGWLWVSDSEQNAPGIGFLPASYAAPL